MGGDGVISFTRASAHYLSSDSFAHGIGTGDFTIQARVRRAALVNTYLQEAVAVGEYSETYNVIEMYVRETSNDKWGFDIGGTGAHNFGTTLTLSTWHTIAIVRSSGTIYGYLDGTVESTTYPSETLGINDSSIRVANGILNVVDYLNGAVEDVAVWNRALSAEELAGMHSARRVAGCYKQGLKGWFPLHCPGNGTYTTAANGDLGLTDQAANGTALLVSVPAPSWTATNLPYLNRPGRPKIIPCTVAGAPPSGVPIPVAMATYRRRRVA
jgi:hypothetical protein